MLVRILCRVFWRALVTVVCEGFSLFAGVTVGEGCVLQGV